VADGAGYWEGNKVSAIITTGFHPDLHVGLAPAQSQRSSLHEAESQDENKGKEGSLEEHDEQRIDGKKEVLKLNERASRVEKRRGKEREEPNFWTVLSLLASTL
jgi:hypothetical protein